jgi:hypothetical protein
MMGILIHIFKFGAPFLAWSSDILAEDVQGRAMGIFLFTAVLMMAL